ncbi:MAG: sodium:proton antiporter [Anaerolineae bacterium]|nr:sodium:proton antiporter [Caldilineales bacterium]MCX7851276.1 sodium:proton antiporter [Caldilineales bacterium]MDW8268071.1 sodium:proton antiporter [Anaerolineae bacterium]
MLDLLKAIAVGAMFAIGLFQLLRRNVIRSAIGLLVITNAVNLFLLMTGAYRGKVIPYVNAVGQRSDALPQALVLTAIVIGMAGFVLVLALLYVLAMRYRTADADAIADLKH